MLLDFYMETISRCSDAQLM